MAAVGAAASVAAVAGKHSLPNPHDPGVEQTTLPNGLRIVTETMPDARSVTIGAWVRVGGRDEPAELSGASHFLEHLLFKGTEQRSARQIAEAVDSVGGEMNAFTAREHTAYYARLPYSQLDLGIEILGDVLSAPSLRPAEVDAERQVIVEEILMNLDAPEDRVHTVLCEAVFPDHPLGRDVLGVLPTIEALGAEDIAGFFERWYRPATMVLAVAGRLEHDAVVAAASSAFASASGGELPERSGPAPLEGVVRVEQDDTEQAHLCLGWRSPSANDEDRWALSVANQVLGGGMASRLFQQVREERGLAYSVYSHPSGYSDSGYLTIYCGTSPKRARETLTVIDDVVAELIADGITDDELRVAAGYLEGSLLLSMEDSGGRMGRLGRGLMHRDQLTSVDDQVEHIRAVTTADVHQVLRRVLDAPRVLAAVGPFSESDLGQ
ncbi:MAG: insulinase family protein [Actinomycetota bacterium]|nr:insulinase family protein [Actinomycetota bacterium]